MLTTHNSQLISNMTRSKATVMKIPFNQPTVTGREEKYLKQVIAGKNLSGDHEFTAQCRQWLEKKFGCQKALLTTSCTHALEMAALLAGIREGDEVIMPSYTFVSTANPFVLRGAKIIFVDIRPDTLNIDENLIEDAVTGKTRAIVPMHYGGVGCEMETILKIAAEYNVTVIEDAAQAMMAKYKGRYLGTLGQIGAFSFHDTKNYTCGEGGAVLINDPGLTGQAEILREKGTDRSEFLRGEIDRYTWVDMGSSYLPSELNAAFLWAQLEMADEINEQRLKCWQLYREKLKPLQQRGLIELPTVPQGCEHNGHVFYVKLKDLPTRTRLMDFLRQNGIDCRFHFIPLHSSAAGKRFGRFHGRDQWTTRESQRMLRLPVYYGITEAQIGKVCGKVMRFFKG